MISDRLYQTPRTRDEAMLELRRCAGTQFDPAVVAAFEEVLSETHADQAGATALFRTA